jgi:hypothetical protein
MEGQFLKVECPRCKYSRAEKSIANNEEQEHFICFRCGYLRLITDGEEKEHLGLGAWMFVSKNGIGASAIYVDSKFFDNLDKLRKAFSGGKLFYTRTDSIGKYLLIDSHAGIKYPFGDDDEIYFGGLRKISL